MTSVQVDEIQTIPWLSPAEQVAWRRFLRATSRLTERLDEGLQRREGLASTDFEILVMLSEAPNHRLRMSELAERVLMSRSRLTYRVDQLAARRLVRRETCDTDGRGLNAALTDAGLALLRRAVVGHLYDVRQYLFDQINPEFLDEFSRLFERINLAVAAEPHQVG